MIDFGSENPIGDTGATKIAEFLKWNTSIQTLDLSCIFILIFLNH